MRNESQDVEGFSVTGTNSTQRVAEQHVTPPTGGMRRTASISATHFVLRECVSSTEEVSMRHVCVLCHPYATDMRLTREGLAGKMKGTITGNAAMQRLKGDPPGTFENKAATTNRNKHLDSYHGEVDSVKLGKRSPPPEDARVASTFPIRIPELTPQEQNYLWMFADNCIAPQICRKESWKAVHPDAPFDSPTTFRLKLGIFAAATQKAVAMKVRGQVCFLLLDGATILSKGLLNIAVGVTRPSGDGCDVYFLRTVNVRNGAAKTLSPIVKELITEIKEVMGGASVIAVVTDNASNMGLTVKYLVDPSEGTMDADNGSESDEGSEDGVDADAEVVEVAMELEDLPDGIIHIRCFAHTFQLVISDLARHDPLIKKAFATTTRIVHLCQCKETKFDLDAVIKESGDVKFALKQPAVTRWNSLVRAMVLVEAHFDDINTVLEKKKLRALTPSERVGMRHAIVVLTPLAWATNTVQADTCSSLDSLRLFLRTRDTLVALVEQVKKEKDRLEGSENGVKPLLTSLGNALRSLSKREAYFFNPLVDMLRALQPGDGVRAADTDGLHELMRALIGFVRQAGLNGNDETFIENLLAELRRFSIRPFGLPDDWWDLSSTMDAYPHLQYVYRRLSQFVMTEAFVERSFGVQKRYMTKYRNKMCILTAEQWVAVAMNYPRLFLAPRATVHRHRHEDLTVVQFEALMARILDTGAPAIANAPRKRQEARAHKADLKPSCLISVCLADDIDPKKTLWHRALIKMKIPDPSGASNECWSVMWLDAEKDEQDGVFYPFTGPGGEADEWCFYNEYLENHGGEAPKRAKK